MWESLLQSPWIIALVAAVPAAVLSVFLTLHFSRRSASLRLAAWSNNLVSGLKRHLPGLAVTYAGKEVPSASVARLSIWNDGNLVLRSSSVEPKDPVAVVLSPGLDVLDLSLLFASDPNSGLSATREVVEGGTVRVRIAFDHVKPGQGAVFQIVHTGTGVADLHLKGTFIDEVPPAWSPTQRRWLSTLFFALSEGLVFVFIFPAFWPFETEHQRVVKAVALAAVAGALVLTLGVDRFSRRRAWRYRVPSGLAPYCEGVTAKSN